MMHWWEENNLIYITLKIQGQYSEQELWKDKYWNMTNDKKQYYY
jgi:hypothetical protein